MEYLLEHDDIQCFLIIHSVFDRVFLSLKKTLRISFARLWFNWVFRGSRLLTDKKDDEIGRERGISKWNFQNQPPIPSSHLTAHNPFSPSWCRAVIHYVLRSLIATHWVNPFRIDCNGKPYAWLVRLIPLYWNQLYLIFFIIWLIE